MQIKELATYGTVDKPGEGRAPATFFSVANGFKITRRQDLGLYVIEKGSDHQLVEFSNVASARAVDLPPMKGK